MSTVTNYYSPSFTAVVFGSPTRQPSSETFSTIRAGVGTNLLPQLAGVLGASTTTNQYNFLARGVMTFDTSSIPGGATITSATINMLANSGSSKLGGLGTTSLELCSATPASSISVASSDYDKLGTTSFGSISYASFTDNAQNTFTLNSSGLTYINKGGSTSFGVRLGWDLNNSFGGSWVTVQATQLIAAGGTAYPILTVNYTVDFPTLSVNNISSLSNVTTITTS